MVPIWKMAISLLTANACNFNFFATITASFEGKEMRRKMVAGNWKMHGTRRDVQALVDAIKQGNFPKIDVVVLPSFVFFTRNRKPISRLPNSLGWAKFLLGKARRFYR